MRQLRRSARVMVVFGCRAGGGRRERVSQSQPAARAPAAAPPPRATMSQAERLNWRMPPLALLKPVQWSTGTKLGVLTLRAYLVISVLLLIVKAVQIGTGHSG